LPPVFEHDVQEQITWVCSVQFNALDTNEPFLRKVISMMLSKHSPSKLALRGVFAQYFLDALPCIN